MTSTELIEDAQNEWAAGRARDARWPSYLRTYSENLFSWTGMEAKRELTRREFDEADGSELRDGSARPAKMRALVSSSALAVNFFEAWRGREARALARALGLSVDIVSLRFEYKPTAYPVPPRAPNLDVLLQLDGDEFLAVESKFCEPFRPARSSHGLAARYLPSTQSLWATAGLHAAQKVAESLRPTWMYLDVPQLLKHLLGLASDPNKPGSLLYLWFDTGLPDAAAHRDEISRFAEAVAPDPVKFVHRTYQQVFRELRPIDEPQNGWHTYMRNRYFSGNAA